MSGQCDQFSLHRFCHGGLGDHRRSIKVKAMNHRLPPQNNMPLGAFPLPLLRCLRERKRRSLNALDPAVFCPTCLFCATQRRFFQWSLGPPSGPAVISEVEGKGSRHRCAMNVKRLAEMLRDGESMVRNLHNPSWMMNHLI